MLKKLKTLWWALYAFVVNFYIEWSNGRLERKRRPWVAYKVGGGGVVPLGRVSQERAIEKSARLGSVSFVDTETAVIFYSGFTF